MVEEDHPRSRCVATAIIVKYHIGSTRLSICNVFACAASVAAVTCREEVAENLRCKGLQQHRTRGRRYHPQTIMWSHLAPPMLLRMPAANVALCCHANSCSNQGESSASKGAFDRLFGILVVVGLRRGGISVATVMLSLNTRCALAGAALSPRPMCASVK